MENSLSSVKTIPLRSSRLHPPKSLTMRNQSNIFPVMRINQLLFPKFPRPFRLPLVNSLLLPESPGVLRRKIFHRITPTICRPSGKNHRDLLSNIATATRLHAHARPRLLCMLFKTLPRISMIRVMKALLTHLEFETKSRKPLSPV